MKGLPASIRFEAERQARANPDAIVSVLDAGGVFVFMSDSVDRIVGYDPEEVLGHHFSEYYSATDAAHLALAMQDALLNDRSVVVTRHVRLKSGDVRHMRGDARKLVDEATGQAYVLSMSWPYED